MTFLERDVPSLGIQVAPHSLRRFWAMVAHYHGCICNFSEIGRSMGCADTTVRRYLDILSGTFMVRQLHPWFENIGKRQVKQPKVYFRDSGILHSLLGIATRDELVHHPKLGASWEGYALEEVIRAHRAQHEDCYFWATHNGAELDLMIVERGRRRGFEFKFADAPRLTRSMSVAVTDLHLDSLTVIVPEGRPGTLGDRIALAPLQTYLDSVRAG